MSNGQEPSRKIFISAPIDNEVALEVMKAISDINEYDNSMSVVSTYEADPIEIYINSGGGGAEDGFAIIGAMEMSETPIVGIAMGEVCSIALGILVMADVRLCTRHTRFMYHSVAYGFGGNVAIHEARLKEANIIQSMYDSLFYEKTKLPRDIMQDCVENAKDFFFSSKQALEYGVVEKIIPKPERLSQQDN